ncbi:MAG: ORF6N domain-containing protein [Candidatus Sumerlaeaceae bacterium]|nr:ORF6N domain-containing protein [Candidatus Sumerlaeaceae bacterium]
MKWAKWSGWRWVGEARQLACWCVVKLIDRAPNVQMGLKPFASPPPQRVPLLMKNDALAVQAERRIYLIRGIRVMLDFDLAQLYGVETRALKQAVRRNPDRFPDDFMFELAADEIYMMVSQNVIPGRSKLGGAIPMAFTEQGVAMLSSVLRSPRALQVNIAIMRPVLSTSSTCD